MRYAAPIPAPYRLVPELLQLLKSKGAPDLCHALSESDELDGNELSLAEALNFIFGREIGTFLSAFPGSLPTLRM
jgi:hypothetical protein